MKISNTKTIELSQSEVRSLLISHFEKAYTNMMVKHVEFVVQGHEDPDDWQSKNPLEYELELVRVEMVPV